MFNEFKNGERVIVCGIGENNGKRYINVPGRIVERDTYYKDYLVRFKNGAEDWIEPKYIRKPYSKKGVKRKWKLIILKQ